MLKVSDLLLQHREVESFAELVEVVKHRAASEMFFRMDLNHPIRIPQWIGNLYWKQLLPVINPMSSRDLPHDLPLSDAERKLMDKIPDAAHEIRVQALEETLITTTRMFACITCGHGRRIGASNTLS